MTPGFAKTRQELPWLYYPEADSVIINAHNFPSAVNLKTGLQWYWDLSAADANITDQHSGLVLSKVGTITTSATGGPDGGACIDVGSPAGKYDNASVARTIDYAAGFSVNIWVRSTGDSSNQNLVFHHRGETTGQYWQIGVRASVGSLGDYVLTWDNSAGNRIANDAAVALNTWQMITQVDTGSAISLYRNGSLISTTATSLGTRAAISSHLAIGGAGWLAAAQSSIDHRGQLAKAGVWSRALTAADITALHNGGAGKNYAAL